MTVAPPSPWFRKDIAVSKAELAAGHLSDARQRTARILLHTQGYVVLRGALPPETVETARAQFGEVYRDCLASCRGDAWYQVSRRHRAVFWQRGQRWRIFPRLEGALADPWLIANPPAMALLDTLLGADCFCKFVSSDTCVRGSELQSPHRELGCGGGGGDWPKALVVNIPLLHCGPHNGPLEVWPGGSHLWERALLTRWGLDTDVQDSRNPEIEALAADWPSVRLELWPGDLLIRDGGLLHRGTPNPTDEPRSMLTVCYFRRGHVWDYGQPEYNLDAELYARLAPAVRRYFEPPR